MKTTDNHNEPKLNLEGISEQKLKRNAFKTPEGYFDNLTLRVMESVRDSKVSTESTWPVWMKVLTPTTGIATIALAVWIFIPPTENETPDFTEVLASLSIEEVVLYAEANPTELVQYELVDYNEVDLSEMTEDELFEYLESEDEIEINTLMNEIEI